MIRSGDAMAAVSARAVSLAESGATQDRRHEWQRLVRTVKHVSVLAAVRSVRSLRESCVLPPGQAAKLIGIVISEPMLRLCRRYPMLGPDGPDLRQERRRELVRHLKVACLRRLGEYGLARLLSTDPKAYDALLRGKLQRGPRLPAGLEQEVDRVLQLIQLPSGGRDRGRLAAR